MYSKTDSRRKCTVFGARCAKKACTYVLSNLSASKLTMRWPENEPNDRDAVRVPSWLRGKVCSYDTSEHAYQALSAGNLESARMFESGGIVSMEIFRSWPKEEATRIVRTDMYAHMMKQWGEKGPGISAKMVSNLRPHVARAAFGMALLPPDATGITARIKLLLRTGPAQAAAAGPRGVAASEEMLRITAARRHLAAMRNERVEEEFEMKMQERMERVELGVWGHILRAKFQHNSDARSVLLGTKEDLLIEKTRMPRQGDYWGAFLQEDGRRIGGNMMGRLLMAMRKEAAAMLMLLLE
jgi:predicted NAD-dependent protein-ADP-ribosyltransferase YbiA (DUF1768 family)